MSALVTAWVSAPSPELLASLAGVERVWVPASGRASEAGGASECPAPVQPISRSDLHQALSRSEFALLLVPSSPLAPGYLERARGRLAEEPELDAVAERWQRRWPQTHAAPLSEACPPRLAYFLPRNVLLRRTLWEAHSGFGAGAADQVEFWTRAALAGARVAALPFAGSPSPASEPAALAQAWTELGERHRDAIEAQTEEVLVAQEALITDLREYRRLLHAEAAEQELALAELNARLAAARSAAGL